MRRWSREKCRIPAPLAGCSDRKPLRVLDHRRFRASIGTGRILASTPGPASPTGFATIRANGIVRAKQSRYLPVVLTSTEVRAVLAHLKSEYWLGRECSAESFGSVSVNAARKEGEKRREHEGD